MGFLLSEYCLAGNLAFPLGAFAPFGNWLWKVMLLCYPRDVGFLRNVCRVLCRETIAACYIEIAFRVRPTVTDRNYMLQGPAFASADKSITDTAAALAAFKDA